MNHNTYIYGLYDPLAQQIFYVGRTVKPLHERLKGHVADAKRGKTNKKSLKIASMLLVGNRPEIREIAKLLKASKEQAIAAEQAWIDFYKITCELTNEVGAATGSYGLTPNKYVWDDEILNKLGKTSDYAISKQIGCSRPTISNLRRSLAIPAYTEDYPDSFYEQLGKVSDGEIARAFSVPRSTVKYVRDSCGIPPFLDPRLMQWEPEHIDLIGKVPDSTAAEIIGCHMETVSNKRKELNIKTCDRSKWRKRKDKRVRLEEVIDRLGKEPDEYIAKDFGVCRTIIRKLRIEAGIDKCPRLPKIKWTREHLSLLGIMSDEKAAKLIGCHSASVFTKRKEMGIPSSNKLEWKSEWLEILYKVPTKELAKLIGCHPATVVCKRKQMRIQDNGDKKNI